MIRWLFKLAALLSLVLCLAAVVLWLRSYRTADVWSAERFRCYGIASWRGALEVRMIHRADFVERLHAGVFQRKYTSAGFSSHWRITHNVSDGRSFDDAKFRCRFGEMTDISNGGATEREGSVVTWTYVRAPHWCAVLLCIVFPVLWAQGVLHRRHLAVEGRCSECGYDLRANVGRCSECGTPAAAETER
jgi:hypothetical protein